MIFSTDTYTAEDLGGGIRRVEAATCPPGSTVEVERVAVFCSAYPTATDAFICDGPAEVGVLPLWNAIDFTAAGSGTSIGYHPPLRIKAGSHLTLVWRNVPGGATCLARVQYVTRSPIAAGG